MPHSIIRNLRALVVAGMIAAPLAAAAATTVDTIVVKYRDDALPASTTRVSDRDLVALGHLHKAVISNLGQARDGAFRLALDPPLSIDDARAAMNKLRMNPAVLYVAISERQQLSKRAAAMKAGVANARPVRTMIVKYKDPDIVAASLANRAPPTASVQLVADAAQTPVATLRAMAGGAYVMQFFHPMAATDAFTVAEALENDPAIEYADPDLWVAPSLIPNDPCFAVNTNASCFMNNGFINGYLFEWHLMPSGSEVGGANLPPAWDITTGSPGIYVGVIDTGFLYNHPDLAGRSVGGYDFIYDFAVANDSQPVQSAGCLQGNDPRLYEPLSPPCVSSRDSDPSDPGDWIDAADYPTTGSSWFVNCPVGASSWHGSHTSGTIGALSNNSTGIAGINWVSKIVPLRVLGKCGGYGSDIVDAMTWGSGGTVAGIPANPYPARVLSMSLGGGGSCTTAQQNAINAALGRGTVFAIAAGNENESASLHQPGSCPGVITVAATQRQGLKAQYSNYGPLVEIAAPGGGRDYPETPSIIRNYVVSTINNGATTPNSSGYIYWAYQGTSMATPHVAGVASLMLSRNPTLTPAQVLSIIQTTSRPFPTTPVNACTSIYSCNCTTSLCGAGMLDAGAALAATPAPPQNGSLLDFNADLKGDILWRNSVAGAVAVWTMNGTTSLGASLIYPGGSNYVVTNAPDLNGDGKSDLIFRNPTGQTAGWLMNGTAVASSSFLLSDANWIVLKTGDFNGDSKEDLLWRNISTGQTAMWLMDGLTSTTATVIFGDPNWAPIKTGDFNGDGKTDIVWRNTSTGQTAIWLMNGTTALGSAVVMSDPNWTVIQTVDLNGDGMSDLVWRNTSTGAIAAWLMNGLASSGAATLVPAGPWTVTHVGDFNGDGKGDLLWRNTSTGETAIWLMNGTAVLNSAIIFGDPNWMVTFVSDTTGDGKSDIFWHHNTSGTALWIMNGVSQTTSAILVADPTWSVSAADGP